MKLIGGALMTFTLHNVLEYKYSLCQNAPVFILFLFLLVCCHPSLLHLPSSSSNHSTDYRDSMALIQFSKSRLTYSTARLSADLQYAVSQGGEAQDSLDVPISPPLCRRASQALWHRNGLSPRRHR